MNDLLNLKEFRKKMGLTQTQLANECGVTIRTVQNWENGGVIPEVARKLILQIKGNPEMVSPAVMTPLDGGEATPMMPIQANIDTGEVSEKKIEPIPATAEVIPIVPSEVASEVNLDVRKFIEHNADELEHIDPTKLLKNPDLAEQIAGTSMLPTFAPNDVVFVKFLPDKEKIIDGKTYYFDTITFPTMIRKVKFESENKLRLIAKNPAFADIIISRCDVQNVGRVIGLFRQTFGDQYDEIEEVRRRKDSQIDKLLDQNSKALESIGELIEVIKDKRG